MLTAILIAGAPATVAICVAAERLPLDQTRSSHMTGLRHQPMELAFPPGGHLLRYDDFMAYRFPGPTIKGASLDKRLSHLCRRGAFRPEKDWRLHAVTTGTAYAVAYGDGANLHDPQKLAKSGMVYFFATPDASACEVLSVKRSEIQNFAQTRLGLEPGAAGPSAPRKGQ